MPDGSLGPQLEPGLEVVVVGARARVVGADGHAHRAVVALLAAHREGEAAGVAVCGDDERRAVLVGLPRRAPALVDGLRGDADDRAAGVGDRGGDVAALDQAGAVLDGVLGEDVVEVHPGADETIGRERGALRPVELESHAGTDDAQPLVADPAVRLGGRDAQVDQLTDRPGGQSVAADLLAGEVRLLEEEHVDARHREVGGGGRSSGTGSDDDDVSRVDIRSAHGSLQVPNACARCL